MGSDSFSFHLPYHKGNRFFEGNVVMIHSLPHTNHCLVKCMVQYIALQDSKFPLLPELWLSSTGDVPTYSWVVLCLQSSLGRDVGSHSLCSGGAMALALASVSDNHIQMMGHWASEMFCAYICKHPVLLHALIHNKSVFAPS